MDSLLVIGTPDQNMASSRSTQKKKEKKSRKHKQNFEGHFYEWKLYRNVCV